MLDNLYVGVRGSARPLWFWIASPAQSLHQLITHSCSLSLLIGFVSLFAGFKDKEILIELLCNLTSQCITRQLDINHPPSSGCVCVCVRNQCELHIYPTWAAVIFFFLPCFFSPSVEMSSADGGCPPSVSIYHNTLLKQHIRCVFCLTFDSCAVSLIISSKCSISCLFWYFGV